MTASCPAAGTVAPAAADGLVPLSIPDHEKQDDCHNDHKDKTYYNGS